MTPWGAHMSQRRGAPEATFEGHLSLKGKRQDGMRDPVRRVHHDAVDVFPTFANAERRVRPCLRRTRSRVKIPSGRVTTPVKPGLGGGAHIPMLGCCLAVPGHVPGPRGPHSSARRGDTAPCNRLTDRAAAGHVLATEQRPPRTPVPGSAPRTRAERGALARPGPDQRKMPGYRSGPPLLRTELLRRQRESTHSRLGPPRLSRPKSSRRPSPRRGSRAAAPTAARVPGVRR